jgi:hypothetical protein
MQRIPDGSVDMILCDLPYGTTACKWDSVIPFAPLWEQYKRIAKKTAAIVLFGVEPFSTKLRASRLELFRYDLIWSKARNSNPMLAKKQPLRVHEVVSVFYQAQPTYNPQGLTLALKQGGGRKKHATEFGIGNTGHYAQMMTGYPKSILQFSADNYGANCLHPTQKPVALFEYLVRTYTNEGETVLDNCAGSCTTAIACLNTNRKYIGFEKDPGYFAIAQKRIAEHSIKLASAA